MRSLTPAQVFHKLSLGLSFRRTELELDFVEVSGPRVEFKYNLMSWALSSAGLGPARLKYAPNDEIYK